MIYAGFTFEGCTNRAAYGSGGGPGGFLAAHRRSVNDLLAFSECGVRADL